MRSKQSRQNLSPALRRTIVGIGLVAVLLLALIGASFAAPAWPNGVPDVRLFDAGKTLGPNAPLGKSSIGDYVWFDANADGQHVGAEAEFTAGVNSVLVNLYLDANFNGIIDPGEFVSSTLTGDNPNAPGTQTGWYDFSVTANGTQYIVEIDPSNFTTGPLVGYVLTSDPTYGPNPLVVPLPGLIETITNADFGFARARVQVVKTAGTAADGTTLYLPGGGPVLYTYVVTNTGQTSLTNIVVKDDNGTPGVPGDDITVCTIAGPLAAGASTTCTTTLTITAIAPMSPPSPASPLTKTACPPATPSATSMMRWWMLSARASRWSRPPARAADGTTLYLSGGGPVLYTYVVTNTGDTYLTNILVKDDNGTPGVPGDDITVCTIAGPLAPGASATCTTTLNITADRTNIATATGTPSNQAGQPLGIPNVSDTDDAVVDVINPSIQVVKTAGTAPDGTTLYLPGGGPVLYTYVVTNTGDTYLANIAGEGRQRHAGRPGRRHHRLHDRRAAGAGRLRDLHHDPQHHGGSHQHRHGHWHAQQPGRTAPRHPQRDGHR